VGRRRRLLLSASFAIPVVGAATLSFFLLREQTENVQMTALVFVAGLYILAAIEDMLEEAHESADDSRWSALSFLGGFALFLLVCRLLKVAPGEVGQNPAGGAAPQWTVPMSPNRITTT
jgi:ZIP family zinc transporter